MINQLNMQLRRLGLIGALWLTTLLAACGGGSNNATPAGPGMGPPPAPPPAAAGPLARIEISPPGGLLVGTTERRTLSIRGFDANGREVQIPDTELSVTSSSPASIEVNRSGNGFEIRAVAPVGTAVLNAAVGTIRAKPAVFYAAEPVAGAVLVSDAQVRAAPVAVDPSARGGLGWRYRVTLTGVGTPAAGSILLGTGTLPIAGRVVSSTPSATSANETDVVLEVLALPALFRNMNMSLQLTPEQTNALFVPNPRLATNTGKQSTHSKVSLSAIECKGDSPALAALTGELEVKVDRELSLDHQLEIVNGSVRNARLIVSGNYSGSGKAVMNLGATVTGGVGCELELGAIPIPITGPLSAFIAPVIPIRFKAELGAQIQVNLFTVSAEIKQSAQTRFGFEWKASSEGGQLEGIKSLTLSDPEVTRNVSFPTDASARVKATLFAGLASGLSVGNALVKLDAIELTAGPEFEAKFGGLADAASDAVYTTEYELKAKAAVGPGGDIAEVIRLLLGSSRAIDLSLKWERSIGKSPGATAVSTEKSTFNAGETVRFDVELNPQSVNFPLVGYNVTEVRIYRLPNVAGASAEQIAAATPTSEAQTSFQINWVADRAGSVDDAGRPNFFAFVVEKPLALITGILPFELGPVFARDVGQQGLVAGSGVSSIAVRANGSVITWGSGDGDVLGRDASNPLPGLVEGLPGPVSTVAAGGWYSVALLADGQVYAWGWGNRVADATAQYGMVTVPRPQRVQIPQGTRITQISTRYFHSLALDSTGRAWGFGPSRWGQLGFTSTFGDVKQVGFNNVRAVAAGERHSLFLTRDGKVLALGDNEFGQLGGASGPVPVPGLPAIKAIAASSFGSYALDETGSVWSWGDSTVLGRTGNSAPARIPGLTGVKAISAGNYTAFALMGDGTVRGWGDDTYGRVGVGAGGGVIITPTRLPGLTDVVEVNGAEFHGIAVTRNGTIYTWGRNDLGALNGRRDSPGFSHVPMISGANR